MGETTTGLVPGRPIFFHGKTLGRIHFMNPALGTWPIIASPQRFLTTTGVVKTLATEDARGEGVGTAAGGMTTATADATGVERARATRRGDKGDSERVALFRSQPDGVRAAEAPDRAAGERMRF